MRQPNLLILAKVNRRKRSRIKRRKDDWSCRHRDGRGKFRRAMMTSVYQFSTDPLGGLTRKMASCSPKSLVSDNRTWVLDHPGLLLTRARVLSETVRLTLTWASPTSIPRWGPLVPGRYPCLGTLRLIH